MRSKAKEIARGSARGSKMQRGRDRARAEAAALDLSRKLARPIVLSGGPRSRIKNAAMLIRDLG